ncbi:MAG: hypothetical protein H6581_04820 [Bacteroidia bacterium]|nr:hypothetical protein [Bacteroidia bacterium]
MKKQFLFFLTLILMTTHLAAQFPENVHAIEAVPNQITEYRGNLADGALMDDLTWAAQSSNACWPATQNPKFRGNHVLHGFQIPPYSEVTITLIPDDRAGNNFSLYGYQVGPTSFVTPPALASCVSCEADHRWDYPKAGKTQDHTRSIFFNSIKNPYNIFIGVAGEEGLTSGGYELKIDLKSKVTDNAPQEELKIYSAKATKGQTLSYGGDLKEGTVIRDLGWAANSSVACFPATQNSKFTGNHVFFVTEIPAYSKMEITVAPKDKNANLSLYAYQDGTTSQAFPPNLNSCVSCEAEHKWDYPKRGKTQDHTRTVYLNAIQRPYRVVIGVAGADGLQEGEFVLSIKTE